MVQPYLASKKVDEGKKMNSSKILSDESLKTITKEFHQGKWKNLPTLSPAIYEAEYSNIKDDMKLFRHFAEQYGAPILELGSGTGRISLDLAKEGYNVVGLEIDAKMINHANKSALERSIANASFVQGDMTDYNLHQEFPLLILPRNTLLVLNDERLQKEATRQSFLHTKPGGRFIIDIFSPSESILRKGHSSGFITKFTHPETGEEVQKYHTTEINPNQHIQSLHIYCDKSGMVVMVNPIHLRYLFKNQLTQMLKDSGFKIEHLFGDRNMTPFNDPSPFITVVARRSS